MAFQRRGNISLADAPDVAKFARLNLKGLTMLRIRNSNIWVAILSVFSSVASSTYPVSSPVCLSQTRFSSHSLKLQKISHYHYIKQPSIRGFFAPYSDRIRVNTEQNLPVYFLNNFPVYHCIRTLQIHVTRIPFYSFDMTL